MYIITVTVCKMGAFGESLAYRSKQPIKVGALVRVSFRKQTQSAIVLSCQTLAQARTMVRSAGFAVHEVIDTIYERFIEPRFLQACAEFGILYQVSDAKILASVTSLTHVRSAKIPQSIGDKMPFSASGYNKTLFSTSYAERISHYAKLVQNMGQTETPIVIICPTQELSDRIARDINTLLADDAIICVSVTKAHSKKNASAVSKKRVIIYCVTAHTISAAFMRAPAFMICEFENHPQYHAMKQPFIDYRLLCDFVARTFDVPITFADFPLSTQAYTSYGEQADAALLPSPVHVDTPGLQFHAYARNGLVETELVGNKHVDQKNPEYKVFGKKAEEVLLGAADKKQSVFIVASRHGYAPSVTCKDCSTIMRCKVCDGMLVLKNVISTKTDARRSLVCVDCKADYPPFDKCPNCDGYTLISLGLGIERIAESALKLIDPEVLFVRNEKSGSLKNIADGSVFKDSVEGNAICIGTIFDLDRSSKKFDHIVIVSHEGIVAAPVANMFDHGEFVARVIRDHAQAHVHIQTTDERSDIRMYTGNDYSDRLHAYVSSAYRFHMLPAPTLAVVVSGTAAIHEKAQLILFENAKAYAATVMQSASYGVIGSKKIPMQVVTYSVSGFNGHQSIVEYVSMVGALFARIPYMRAAFVPYATQNRYRLGGFV